MRVGRASGVGRGRVAQDGEAVVAVLDGGGEVAADGEAVLGAFFAGQSAGDVLADLGQPQVAFGLVGGGRHLQVEGEAQHVVLAVAQDLQEQPGLALPGVGPWPVVWDSPTRTPWRISTSEQEQRAP